MVTKAGIMFHKLIDKESVIIQIRRMEYSLCLGMIFVLNSEQFL